ncbi:MAG: hypothetical protein NT007_18490 [Candidatus Kapabacteria bacterium]|nr:hypothetical protein [Candidatus Kapabacteria bacterium]
MLKKIIIISFIFSIFSSKYLSAQDNSLDTLNFQQSAPQEEEKVYFGIGIGYHGSLLFGSTQTVNDKLAIDKFGFSSKLANRIFMNGIEGTIITFKPKNLRLSVYWQSGSIGINATQKIAGVDYNKYVDYSAGFTGLGLSYALMPFKSLAILPSLSGGLGRLSIENYRSKSMSWGDLKPPSDTLSYMIRSEWNGYFVAPALNIEYAVTEYLVAKFSAMYYYNSKGTWKNNNNFDLKDVPSTINNDGLALQVGVFFGLFNY